MGLLEESNAQMYRIQFARKLKDNYTKDEVKGLLKKYIEGISKDKRSIYDNFKSISNLLDSNEITLRTLLEKMKEVLDAPNELDLIDIIRYKAYYRAVETNSLLGALKYHIDDENIVNVGSNTYVWNVRKNYFNTIQRGLGFYKAIDIIERAEYEDMKQIGENTYVFGFMENDIFLVIEVTKRLVIRIKSFRRSDLKEYKKIMEV